MYSSQPSFVLGFHGCDQSVAEDVLAGNTRLAARPKDYDWLGHGIYFWENNPERALQWAADKKKRSKPNQKDGVTCPAVIGAIIDLGYCLNLLETKTLTSLRDTYDSFAKVSEKAGTPIPTNKPFREGEDLIFRHLDCAVIQHMHTTREKAELEGYDSVRGVFFEGDVLYPNAGFKEKNHIQVCVRNPNCIKGYFRVLDAYDEHRLP